MHMCIYLCVCVCVFVYMWASQVVLVVRNSPASARDVREADLIPGLERPLEEDMATHSNILPWRIPWTEEPGRICIVHRVTKVGPN